MCASSASVPVNAHAFACSARRCARRPRTPASATLRGPAERPPVLARHPPDKIPDLSTNRCPAGRPSPLREPPPVQREARTVPPDHRLRLHDDDRIGPSCPHAPQHNPERPVHQPNPRPALLQHGGELLPEGEVLEHEAPPRPEPPGECDYDRPEESNHGGPRGCRPRLKTSTVLGGTRFWRATGGHRHVHPYAGRRAGHLPPERAADVHEPARKALELGSVAESWRC